MAAAQVREFPPAGCNQQERFDTLQLMTFEPAHERRCISNSGAAPDGDASGPVRLASPLAPRSSNPRSRSSTCMRRRLPDKRFDGTDAVHGFIQQAYPWVRPSPLLESFEV